MDSYSYNEYFKRGNKAQEIFVEFMETTLKHIFQAFMNS